MGGIKRLAALALMATTCATQAGPVFQGRLADGSASSTCTVSGDTKCAMFYFATLDITILNNWNIGSGPYRRDAFIGSAQYFAEFDFFGFTGWGLPTGDGSTQAGTSNQFRSIFEAAGGTLEGLSRHFDGVQGVYWSASSSPSGPADAWAFHTGDGSQALYYSGTWWNATAVRSGDVAPARPEVSPVSEPATLALVSTCLIAMTAMRKRSSASIPSGADGELGGAPTAPTTEWAGSTN